MVQKNRLIFYDILKGYAIFLVVLGHVIQNFNSEWETDNLFLGIYMFHMPLFIAISGFFFAKSADKRTTKELLKRRFVNIMLPSLTAGFINVAIIGGGKILRHKPIDFLYLSDLLFTGLWFLTVLFILTVIATLLYKEISRRLFYPGWLVVWLIFYFLPDFWVFDEIEFLLPFYVLGIACRNIKLENMNVVFPLFAVMAFCICFSMFTYDNTMYAMGNDCCTIKYLHDTLLRLVCGVSGIVFSLAIISLAMKIIVKSLILSTVGTMTLPIYVLHQKLLSVNKALNFYTGNVAYLCIIAMLTVFITVIIYNFLRKNRYVALLLFGEVRK